VAALVLDVAQELQAIELRADRSGGTGATSSARRSRCSGAAPDVAQELRPVGGERGGGGGGLDAAVALVLDVAQSCRRSGCAPRARADLGRAHQDLLVRLGFVTLGPGVGLKR
jgi:hypothetical protein